MGLFFLFLGRGCGHGRGCFVLEAGAELMGLRPRYLIEFSGFTRVFDLQPLGLVFVGFAWFG